MDPVSFAAARAAKSVRGDSGKLMSRLLGPACDVIGEWLADKASYRLNNVHRIVGSAAGKTNLEIHGEVPPRVAHRILQEGSFSDDQLMAEYLGGVLAASRTPSGRDDRGVAWNDIVSSMSSLEVRAHFILYRAWDDALHGRADVNLWKQEDRRSARLFADEIEFQQRLLATSDGVPVSDALSHALLGLERRGLLDSAAWGTRDYVRYQNHDFAYVITAELTLAGIELYGWALGLPGLTADGFTVHGRPWTDESLPRLVGFSLPGVSPGSAA